MKQDKFDILKTKLENQWLVDSNVGLSKNCRILLVWDSSRVNVSVLHKHEQYMHCLVQMKDLQWSGVIIIVYALNLVKIRGFVYGRIWLVLVLQ